MESFENLLSILKSNKRILLRTEKALILSIQIIDKYRSTTDAECISYRKNLIIYSLPNTGGCVWYNFYRGKRAYVFHFVYSIIIINENS